MPDFFTEEEVNFIEELSREINNWHETHDKDVDVYRCSDNAEENARNTRIRQLSNELYAYYYNLRDDLEDILMDIHLDQIEYNRLKAQTNEKILSNGGMENE